MTSQKKYSILIIDDEKSNIIELTDILDGDYDVYALKESGQAQETVERIKPNIILLDIIMPDMDGYEVIMSLKNREKTRDIPVIFITGLDSIEAEERGFSSGAADYITKPFHAAIVKMRIANQIKIIERNEIEHKIIAAEAANRAKNKFLANVTHEIRTPMNIIVGMTLLGKRESSIEKKNNAFEKIGEASTQLIGIVNDIIDFTEIEEGKMVLSNNKFRIGNMVDDILTVARINSNARRQTIFASVDEKIPAVVIGDEQRLAQVLRNLMSNAIKFSNEGGLIKLEAALIEDTGEYCELNFKVTDNGIGISSEQQKTLFEAFEQVESGTTRSFGGTGMGLAISRRIVEAMGDRLRVESELGKGSMFEFNVRLPVST